MFTIIMITLGMFLVVSGSMIARISFFEIVRENTYLGILMILFAVVLVFSGIGTIAISFSL